MPLDPYEYSENEAWLLFQLNNTPVRTEMDGDFNAIAIMDVASGMIFGMELVPIVESEISEFQSRKLLSSSESRAKSRPRLLFVPSERKTSIFSAVASKMGIVVEMLSESEIESLTKEAIDGFSAHMSRQIL
ncbi:MAG: hypothetical protein OEZ58_11485 [Gammaproteobacteria bacterium]|nr:hypothetical protein [Gammaproteobacteria bacterium]